MKLVSKLQKFINEKAHIFLHIIATIVLSVLLTLFISGYPQFLFPMNLVMVAAFAVCVSNFLFRHKYSDSLLKMGCVIVIFLTINDLYSYESLKKYIPQLEGFSPLTLSVIIAAIAVVFIILYKLIQCIERREERTSKLYEEAYNVSENGDSAESATVGDTDKNSENDSVYDKTHVRGGNRLQEIHGRFSAYVVAVFTVVTAVATIITPIYLLYTFNTKNIDIEALDFDKMLSFLVSYGVCGILIVFALLITVIVVLYIFRYIIWLLRQTISGLAGGAGNTTSGLKSEEGFPTYAFSAVVTAVLMFLTWRMNDYELENLTETLISANYLALPLTAIVIVVLFFVLLQIINTMFLLIKSVTSDSVKQYLWGIEVKLGILTGTMDILELIVHIIMGSVTAILELVDFVPNFFVWLKDFVLGDEAKRERQSARELRKSRLRNWGKQGKKGKADQEENTKADTAAAEDETVDLVADTERPEATEENVPGIMDEQKAAELERKQRAKDDKKGIYIIRVAAFCFAVVSWLATSSGLRAYVFTDQSYLQAYMISFGVQAMLFVMNLQLPSYFARIGKNVNTLRGQIVAKGFFAIFYLVILVSSSLFSFVYITSSVYEDTRYNDSSLILESKYRTYLSKLEEYVDDSEQISLLNINSVLAELAAMVPDTENQEMTLEELETALDEAELEFSKAESALMVAENRYNSAVAVRDVSNTEQWRSNSDHEQERQEAEEALLAYQEALDNYSEKEIALEAAQKAVEEYVEPTSEIINTLLVEFMGASPDEDTVSRLMEQLESMVFDLAEEQNDSGGNTISNNLFAEIVAKNEELTLAVDRYYTLLSIKNADGSMNDISELKEALLDGTAIPVIPSSQDSAEKEVEIANWSSTWRENFETLKGMIQNAPTYSAETLNNIKNTYGSIETDTLIEFDPSEYVTQIDNLVRNNLSEISEVEWAGRALSGEYPFMAIFSLCFAVLLDFSSLMAGLFIYYVTRRKKDNVVAQEYTSKLT